MQTKFQRDIFAVLNLETHNILGRVISIGDNALVFRSVSDDEIRLDSTQHMDVFTSGQIYFRDMPVKIVSDEKIQDQRSFSKMLIREIKVSYDGDVFVDLTPGMIEGE